MESGVHARRRAASLLMVALATGCRAPASATAAIETVPVARQDLVVNVEATGVVEPIDAIEVKSKASGQITKMPVVVGATVRLGELLVEVDPRQMQSQYDAAVAALESAQENLAIAKVQLDREDSLLVKRVITPLERESAAITYANARSAVAAAKNSVQIASINLADATVVSPVSGTVIAKSVSLGQVITSATNVVGGGTGLVTIADLGQVLDSALVNESDIGRVKIGQEVAVTVDAFPTRTFHGRVERISPQAIIQQSVTTFPVLVRLDNRERLLMPGMTTDATIGITRIVGAVAVPNDAIGSTQEAMTLARVLGIGASDARVSEAGGEVSGADSIRTAVVFVRDSATQSFALRLVTLGGGNYDYTHALSGVEPGERVALLSDVRVAASRDTTLQAIQGRSGISGMTGGRGAGAGAGGGRRGGGP